MEETISASDARERFDDLLAAVMNQSERFLTEQRGVSVAAIVPVELSAQWQRKRATFLEQMR